MNPSLRGIGCPLAGIATFDSAAATIGYEPAMPSTESDSLDRLSPGVTAVIAALDFEEAERGWSDSYRTGLAAR